MKFSSSKKDDSPNYLLMCPSFHGSTLLSILLNNHKNISCLGDTNPILDIGLPCGCYHPVDTCPFWVQLLKEAEPFITPSSLGKGPLPFRPGLFPGKWLNKKITSFFTLIHLHKGVNLWPHKHTELKKYLHIQHMIKKYTCKSLKTETYMDGSKNLVNLSCSLSQPSCNNTHILHLVRDPRAYFYSTKKYRPTCSAKKTAKDWLSYHTMVEKAAYRHKTPYLKIRLEDMCRNPETNLKEICAFLKVDFDNLERAPDKSSNFHIIGNSMIHRFDGKLVYDEKWKDETSEEEQSTIIKYSKKLFDRYGYA